MASNSVISETIIKNKAELLSMWEQEQKNAIRSDLVKINELRSQLNEFIELFIEASKKNNFRDILESFGDRAGQL